MSKTITQLTETTTVDTDDILHIVDVSANQDKKIKAANLWSGKPYGALYLNGNSNVSTIAVAGTYYNITAGTVTTTAGILNKFTHTAASGRLTYTGTEDVVCKIDVALSGTINDTLGSGGGNDDVRIDIRVNSNLLTGTRVQGYWNGAAASHQYDAAPLTGITTLSNGDYIEIYITQLNGTDGVIINYLNLNVTAL